MNEPDPESQPTRWTLLARLKDWGDEKSWREFFELYWRLIYATALKAGLSDAEAKDAVQDTIISVAKKIHEFRCDPAAGSFKSWLLHLTRWRILNQIRKRGPGVAWRARAPSGSIDESSTATVERLPDPASLDLNAFWDSEWERHLAQAAKERVQEQVSARQFQIYELYTIQEWPVRKIASLLGVSASQVYLARHRVGALLRREVARLKARF